MLTENTIAPNFTATIQDGSEVSLDDLLTDAEYLLLYFYPADHTPGCTVEAEVMRDLADELDQSGIVVVGVSTDSTASHQKFIDDLELPFNLISDPGQKLIDMYHVNTTDDLVDRCSYLIDSKKNITKVYTSVDPASHADEVIGDVNSL